MNISKQSLVTQGSPKNVPNGGRAKNNDPKGNLLPHRPGSSSHQLKHNRPVQIQWDPNRAMQTWARQTLPDTALPWRREITAITAHSCICRPICTPLTISGHRPRVAHRSPAFSAGWQGGPGRPADPPERELVHSTAKPPGRRCTKFKATLIRDPELQGATQSPSSGKFLSGSCSIQFTDMLGPRSTLEMFWGSEWASCCLNMFH